MVDGSSVNTTREQLLETIISIETQTLVNIILAFFVAYIFARIITALLSKLSEKMSRSGRIKVKMVIPAVKFGIYIVAFYYFLTEILLHKSLPFYTRLRAKAYVNDLRDEFEFESDIHTRAWTEFEKNGIRAPQLHILNIPQIGEEPELRTTSRRKDRSNGRHR